MISFQDIHKRFGKKVVLQGVSLEVPKGKIQYIIGTSGAGKSVLTKHLVGLLRPDQGRVLFDGRDITNCTEQEFFAVRRRVATVFQHATLFDSMTMAENVALPLRKHQGLKQEHALARAMDYLKQVQMADYAHRYPSDVGDGLRKRVAIARALTMEPEVVIFDEPTTGIDPLAAANVDQLIRDLSEQMTVTSIVISHDLRSIFRVADRVAMLYKGRVLLEGTPEEFRQTTNPVVRQFINGDADGPMEFPGVGQ